MCAKSLRSVTLTVSFAVCFLAVSACSDLQQGKRAEDDAQTLRALAQAMAESVPWTDELERDRLTATVSVADGVDRHVLLSPLSFLAGAAARKVPPVYPFLEGFGSLDTTLIVPDVKTVLDGFCDAVCRAENADSFMARGCLYQLALFYRDGDLVLPESSPDADSDEKKPAFSFFDTYFYGQPYVTGETYEVPVRFVGEKRSMDVLVFLLKEGDAWKIDELRILRAEDVDGA
ncbi:MAG: hypothetical protein K2N31_08985 [Treponemataceae bacterium]|nr:hypothetical protein [Treponemataceae bacterium]